MREPTALLTLTTTLITGASRGLGYETTRRLRVAGHTVYLGTRDLLRGERVAAIIGATAIRPDVTDNTSATAAALHIRDQCGCLDVLVNNAGIAGDQRPPGEAAITDLRRVLETNVSSTVGSLTLNSKPDANWSMLAYPMSKAALNMLTIQYTRAYPRWRVNSATPGQTATQFAPTASDGQRVEQGAEILVRMVLISPDGPTGTFVDINGPGPVDINGPVPW